MEQPPVNTCAETAVSPAQIEEERLQLVYDVRDRLMRLHAFPEKLATEIGELCVDTLAQVDDGELLAAKRVALRRSRRRRDEMICAELRTGNADDVGRRWNLSARRVYEIAATRRR